MWHWCSWGMYSGRTDTTTDRSIEFSTIGPTSVGLKINWARALCDQDNLHAALVLLGDVFRKNGYNNRQLHRVLNRQPNISRHECKLGSVSFLPSFPPYVGTIFNRISRVLSRHIIKSVGLPPNKLPSFLQPVKDSLGLRTQGVYSIPCGCSKVYIDLMGLSMDMRLKEHQRHIRLEHPDKSAVAEHSIDLRYRIQLQNTSILATKT
ncbi:uncharacterized protein LOC111864596 [Cryptotermes secundus]|uniref:uncharacterized protein LOC111864596 n=1 Tax=Cryptotermes secundus TaxID=105785 RepID=UPI000CD7DED0|nr:uncharacterized protein LOC111864596 [Cryptotermes secundus]